MFPLPTHRRPHAVSGSGLRAVAAVSAMMVVLTACNPFDKDPPPRPPLWRSVVQLAALDGAGNAVWTGSGTFISRDGLILTNAHVVDDPEDKYETLVVGIPTGQAQPPSFKYQAEVAAVDSVLDLAVVRVARGIDGKPISNNVRFPAARLGGSDQVRLEEPIRIVGFPGIGGQSITVTQGTVSGFTAQEGVGGRAWIKTDAAIAGGNSGGLAADADDRVIGVPSIVGSGEADANVVDCRTIADTNKDRVVDDRDTCVPTGGFINGIRPVELAGGLIEAARAGLEYESPYGATSGSQPDIDNVEFSDLVFSDSVVDDMSGEILDIVPPTSTRVCAFWTFAGMADGLRWDGLWYVNGTLAESSSFVDQRWASGAGGETWICLVDSEGLEEGLYELVLAVGQEQMLTGSVSVGDQRMVRLELDYQLAPTVCYVYISPSLETNWGESDLEPDTTLDPGESATFIIPAGKYDLLLEDCDGQRVFESSHESFGMNTTVAIP